MSFVTNSRRCRQREKRKIESVSTFPSLSVLKFCFAHPGNSSTFPCFCQQNDVVLFFFSLGEDLLVLYPNSLFLTCFPFRLLSSSGKDEEYREGKKEKLARKERKNK